ncbi:MAG: hypothetical protein HRU11_07285 [Parvularculaceae bacterium]|nr:hypothetical protein [Parvularculaceae bacterium]
MKVILVHGTFDGDSSEKGDRWWQKSGAMRRDLEADGHEVEAFRWSGENSDTDRVKAAKQLAKKLDSRTKGQETVGVVAHSHGGNVLREALAMMKKDHVGRVKPIAVGTPFLDRTQSLLSAFTGRETPWLAAIFFLVMLASSLDTTNGNAQLDRLTGFETLTISIMMLSVLAWAAWSVRRFFRRRADYKRIGSTIRAITHPRDEAVSFLYALSRAKINPTTTAEAIRLTRKSLDLPAALASAAVTFMIARHNASSAADASFVDVWIIPLLVAPVFFAAGFVVLRVLIWLISIPAAFFIAPLINGIVSTSLRSAALGLDGSASVHRVGAKPSAYHAVPNMPEAVVQSMIQHTDQHLGGRVSELRAILTDASAKGGDMFALLNDSFTWDELIHTAYFRVSAAREHVMAILTEPADKPS